jgi:hypothetical protein
MRRSNALWFSFFMRRAEAEEPKKPRNAFRSGPNVSRLAGDAINGKDPALRGLNPVNFITFCCYPQL